MLRRLSLCLAVVAGLLVFTGSAKALVGMPSTYDFGSIDRHAGLSWGNITITNDTGATVTTDPSGPTLSGSSAFQWTGSHYGCHGATLYPGNSCFTSVYFGPSAGLGPHTGLITLTDSDGNTAEVELVGTVESGQLETVVQPHVWPPNPWKFGPFYQSVTFKNESIEWSASNYSTAEIVGPDAALFQVWYNGCQGWVGAKSSCPVDVLFDPDKPYPPDAPARATLRLTDPDGKQVEQELEGYASVGPQLKEPEPEYNFGDVKLGEVSDTIKIPFENVGDSPLAIEGIFFVGPTNVFERVTDTCSGAVLGVPKDERPDDPPTDPKDPKDVVVPDKDPKSSKYASPVPTEPSCEISVRFRPNRVGWRDANLLAILKEGGRPVMVALTGRGVPAADARPIIKGEPRIGRTLRCEAPESEGDLSYQWLRNGQPVPGATETTFALERPDWRKFIACQVTATNTVSENVTESVPTVPVRARDLTRLPSAFSNRDACRVIRVPGKRLRFAGKLRVKVKGGRPATGSSPIALKSRKGRVAIRIGGKKFKGRTVRISPRAVAHLRDGVHRMNVRWKGRKRNVNVVLTSCQLVARTLGAKKGPASVAISSAVGMRRAVIKLNKSWIKRLRKAGGEITIEAHGNQQTFRLKRKKRAVYNGVKVKLGKKAIRLRKLPWDTGVVIIRVNGGKPKLKKPSKVKANAVLVEGGKHRAVVR